jgi:GTP cyclohydrolase I
MQPVNAPITKQIDRERIEEAVRILLGHIDRNPERPGLKETPKRVAKAWIDTWACGYDKDPASVLKTFEDGAENVNELVVVNNIPVYTHCEHHLAPFFGVAHIGYIPNKRIVGLSKFKRLTDIFARRLQVQERLTNQIADAIQEYLEPKGVGVVIECRHLCMESRGIQTPGSTTTTSALRGALFEDLRAREEFLQLIRSKTVRI